MWLREIFGNFWAKRHFIILLKWLKNNNVRSKRYNFDGIRFVGPVTDGNTNE